MVELIGTSRANQILEMQQALNTANLAKHLSKHGIEPIGKDSNGNLKWSLTEICKLAEAERKPKISPPMNAKSAAEILRILDINFDLMGKGVSELHSDHEYICQRLDRIEEILKEFVG